MKEPIEKLADSILDIVDGYANLDHLWVPSWDNKDITEYEALKIAIANEIKWYVDKLEKENEELREYKFMYDNLCK